MDRTDTRLVSPATLRRLGQHARELRGPVDGTDPSATDLCDAKDIDVLRDELTRGRFEQAAEQLNAMCIETCDAVIELLPAALAARLGFGKIH